MRQALILITLATLVTVPALYLRITGSHIELVTDTTLYGVAIVAAAFLLAWAAEAAEVDISQALAVAFIAFVAVLPEYAVDLTFAWKAGKDPEFAQFAVANMTGANRLLIGLGWSAVFFIFWMRTRGRVLSLRRGNALDVVALTAATLYSFTIPLKGSISLLDTVVLFAIFVAYMYGISRAEGDEPHLVGPAAWLGGLAQRRRRLANTWLFIFAAAVILASAEHFAEGLVESGTKLGIDEFLLVQWLAPLASEAPEFLVAGILAFRGRASVGLAALLSSKVNQWTLLVGGLPVVYSISSGTVEGVAGVFGGGLPMDARQSEEVLLTAAQSLFAVAVLISLSLGRYEAGALLGLFLIQFLIPISEVRLVIAGIYIVLAVVLIGRQRREVRELVGWARMAIQDRERLEAEEAAERPSHG
ncbi:MAG: sodium:calcium antiporter [Chloroflexi bacterium]|nr:sodium:calcium antiporter [Chloroflexota bacterium]